MFFRLTSSLVIIVLIFCSLASAQEKADSSRPLVRGGMYDKPFTTRLFGRTALGGYTEAVWKFERSLGVTDEVTFEARRFNLFSQSTISDRVRLFAELEFEHGTEEIKLEAAALDFELHPLLIFRGGILLSPLGKFNLSHDSPLNELTDRPLVSTQIIPTALSEAGMGFYGSAHPWVDTRVTYEAYAVNGFNDRILGSGDGVRIAEGRGDVGEDNNAVPSFVGRVSLSRGRSAEVGISAHTGIFNRYRIEDFVVDEKRNLTIMAVDWEFRRGPFELLGEYARASVDVPQSLVGLFAEGQQGAYVQLNGHFGKGWIGAMPRSHFSGIVRWDGIDFDSDLAGDSERRLTAGLNFRYTEDTVFKLDYHHDRTRSRVNVSETAAGMNFSVASYF